jgi:iron(III) transport system ATP-binding protein
VEGPRVFVAPEKRRVGLVFQDLALFPHLNARSNAMFGLFRESRADAARRAEALLEMVGLGGHAASFPHQLSGGEQQRLAVARALAPEPKVMLLDEPFSGLDDRLRDGVRGEVLSLLRRRGAATLFVTHDPDEALRSADRIVLLRQGRIAQAGPPAELWARPADLGVAAFFSPVCTVPAEVWKRSALTPLGAVSAPGFGEGQAVLVALRPRDLELAAGGRALRPDTLALASDGLHVRFAPDEALPGGLSGVFEPNAPIRAGAPVPVAIRPGHGFVFHRECS